MVSHGSTWADAVYIRAPQWPGAREEQAALLGRLHGLGAKCPRTPSLEGLVVLELLSDFVILHLPH